MQNKEKLRVWRDVRNIKQSNTKVFVANVIEELLEIYYSDKDEIVKYKNYIMGDFFNHCDELSEYATLDSIQDIRVFSENETELMGYDSDLALSETICEIGSRVQNPAQKEVWDKWGASGKWEKLKDQPTETLYIADYQKAKLCER